MFEEQPADVRNRVKFLATEAQARHQPYGWFETLYAQAEGQADQVPWAKSTAHPYLQTWLAKQPQPPSRSKALVIGCGLGDDAEALQAKGYQVIAFDVSPTAIAWCQQRFPRSVVDYQVADLFQLSPKWKHAFDLVYECRNLQALPINLRSYAVGAIAPLMTKTGQLLVITRIRPDERDCDGPPWPLSPLELAEFTTYGLAETNRTNFAEGQNGSIQQSRMLYQYSKLF